MDEEKMLEWTMMAVEAITSKGTHGKYLLRIFHMYILDKPFDMFILQCIVEGKDFSKDGLFHGLKIFYFYFGLKFYSFLQSSDHYVKVELPEINILPLF